MSNKPNNREKTPWNPSKRAIAGVKNPIPPPKHCRYCSDDVHIVNNQEIYGRAYGRWPWAYCCKNCGAYVGMHPFTDIPLGTLADKKLRNARKESKEPFERLREDGVMSRDDAYAGLAAHMGLGVEQCHFGWFELADCEKAKTWAIAQYKVNRVSPSTHELGKGEQYEQK